MMPIVIVHILKIIKVYKNQTKSHLRVLVQAKKFLKSPRQRTPIEQIS